MDDSAPEPRSRLSRLWPRRLALRSRILAIFMLGTGVLAIVLAFTTYGLTRSTLVHQREENALRQAYYDARIVRSGLRSNPTSAQSALAALPDIGTTEPLVRYRGEWTNTSPKFEPDSLPSKLRTRVIDDVTASRMLYGIDGQPLLAIGIPLPDVDASYFEVVPLDEVSRTLGSVRVSLLGAGTITIALGVLLGAWAARRAVRPLADAAQAAQAIAGGGLGTRLEPGDDPDLQVLAGSFNDMASALQQRVERDARFASDVSHELRSPLTTLATSAEVLNSRRDELPEKAGAAVDLIVADVGRFQNLVEDLLEISRFDAGAVRLHREDLLVAEFVRQAVSVSSLPDADLQVDPRAEDLVIQADKRRLARVVTNLIDNARYYGGGEVTVTVAPASPDGEDVSYVQIAVEDHGPGVPTDERLLIFERFARGASAGRRGTSEGAGLGLALVDEHVRLHGGQVWVEDRRDGSEGARFVIELPAGAGMRRRAERAAGGVLGVAMAVLVFVACGLPTDGSPRDVGPDFSLDPSSPSSVAAAVPSTSGTRAYFLSGPPDEPGTLLPVTRRVNSDLGVMQALLDGLTRSEQARGLRTAIPEGTEIIDTRFLPDGTMRVNLNDAIFNASRSAQTEAVAQIVFTATGTGAPSVELLVDGEHRAWPRGDGSLEDGPLNRFMFPALNPSSRPDYPPFPTGGVVVPPASISAPTVDTQVR